MQSEISIASPSTREIFTWLLLNANHKDGKVNGRIIKRGQKKTSYKEIQEGLSWQAGFVTKCYPADTIKNALRWLRQHRMVNTSRTTRGILITICNYDHYQAPENYAYTSRPPSGYTSQALPINNNENNKENIYEFPSSDFPELDSEKIEQLRASCRKIADDYPRVMEMENSLTAEEYYKLVRRYPKQKVFDILNDMDNYKKLNDRVSAYKTALSWLKRNKEI